MVFLPHGDGVFSKGADIKIYPRLWLYPGIHVGLWVVWLSLHENTNSLSVLFQIECHAQIIQLAVGINIDGCMCTTCA